MSLIVPPGYGLAALGDLHLQGGENIPIELRVVKTDYVLRYESIMYLADIHIRNYRCFADERILFAPGVNVLLGENNGGKTTVISALSLVLDQGSRRRPQFFDFHHPPIDERSPPAITISVTFRSSDTDTVQDKALVATWLTRLDPPWEAQVTYTFMLEPDDHARCNHELSTIPAGDRVQYRRIVESFLDKYVAHTYGGNFDNRLVADRESLDKISLHSLDALRDAQRELFSGTNPLLKRLLRQVRDCGKTKEEQAAKAEEFITLATALGTHMHSRISLDPLLQLVTDTGALEGGKPHLKDNLGEDDVLAALRLHVENNGVSLPAELNGLGYNNLIYISSSLQAWIIRQTPRREEATRYCSPSSASRSQRRTSTPPCSTNSSSTSKNACARPNATGRSSSRPTRHTSRARHHLTNSSASPSQRTSKCPARRTQASASPTTHKGRRQRHTSNATLTRPNPTCSLPKASFSSRASLSSSFCPSLLTTSGAHWKSTMSP